METQEQTQVRGIPVEAIPEAHCKRCSSRFSTDNLFSPEGLATALSTGYCERCFASIFDEGQDSE